MCCNFVRNRFIATTGANCERGAAAAEYALLASLCAFVLIASTASVGQLTSSPCFVAGDAIALAGGGSVSTLGPEGLEIGNHPGGHGHGVHTGDGTAIHAKPAP